MKKLSTLLWLVAFCLPAQAAIYKCVDDEGLVSYSQSPCPGKQQAKKITTTTIRESNTEMCQYVGEYATDLAIGMRKGIGSDQQIDSRGGLDHISRGAMAIINHVYFYKANPKVGPVKIGAIARSKCNGGAFSAFTKQDIPPEYYDPEEKQRKHEKEQAELRRQANDQLNQTGLPGSQLTAPGNQQELQQLLDSLGAGGSSLLGDAGANPGDTCKMYKNKMDQIEDQMRAGYTNDEGDKLRQQRRELRSMIKQHCN